MGLHLQIASLNSAEHAFEKFTEGTFRAFRKDVEDFQLIHSEQTEFYMADVDLVTQSHDRNKLTLDLLVGKGKGLETLTDRLTRVAVASRWEQYLEGLRQV